MTLNKILNGAYNYAKASTKPHTAQSMARLQICNTCTNLNPSKACNVCGCFVDKKVRLADEQCPIGKW